ncbi:MAG: ATP-binding protein [Gemmatimonadaceae bacterium]
MSDALRTDSAAVVSGATATSRQHPLRRLRLRLTVWYIGTFFVILLLLGAGLFVTIRRQLSHQLDDALRSATTDLARAARIRQIESTSAHGQVMDAVDELHIPDRTLYLVDRNGGAIRPDTAPEWVRAAARRAGLEGRADEARELAGDRTLLLHAERFALPNADTLVAVAVADRVELEDRYAKLIAAFGSAAIVAIVLAAAGGWLLVRESTAPVERSIDHMRRFMADAAHELRTPLAILRARAEVALQQARPPDEYAAALRGIEGESRRLGQIIEDLLTLARADAGERPIVRTRVFLDDIAVDAASGAQVLAAARGVTLMMADYEEAAVEGNAELLRQLVVILIENAVKFTPTGGRIFVGVTATTSHPTLTVQDSGLGIRADELPHVFERFWRGDPSRRRAENDGATTSEGAGLGLSIARWIADAHGADISISSTVGSGTRVTVSFPPATRERLN